MNAHEAQNPIQTTKKSVLILEQLATQHGATLAELDTAIDLSKGALYNHLATLEELGLVVKRDTKYYLSLDLLRLGDAARSSHDGLDAARTNLRDLADTTGEFASLVVLEDGNAIVVETVTGHLTDRQWYHIGDHLPLHSTAAGKTILAEYPEESTEARVRASIGDSDVDVDDILEEIQTVRIQGLSFSRGEYESDQYSVAAPVYGRDGDLLYVIVLTGPESRMSGKSLQQDYAGLVVSTATEIRKQLLK